MYKLVFVCLVVVATLAPSSAEIVKRSKRGILDDLLRHDPHFSTKAPKHTTTRRTTRPTTRLTTKTTTTLPVVTESTKQADRKKAKKLDPSKFKDINLIELKEFDNFPAKKVATKEPTIVKKDKQIKKKEVTKKSQRKRVKNVEEEEEYVEPEDSNIAEKFRQKVDFSSDNIARKETVGEDGEIKGEYSYTDPNGKLLVVRYTAGKDGFKVEVPEEATKSSPSTLTRKEQKSLNPQPKIDNKKWINSLFARTPSPRRTTTTTTTTTPAPTTTTQPPPPQPLRQSLQRQQQRFPQQPSQRFPQQRFQAPPPTFQAQAQAQNFQPNQFSGSRQQQFRTQPQFEVQQQQFQQLGQFQQQQPSRQNQRFSQYDYDYYT